MYCRYILGLYFYSTVPFSVHFYQRSKKIEKREHWLRKNEILAPMYSTPLLYTLCILLPYLLYILLITFCKKPKKNVMITLPLVIHIR